MHSSHRRDALEREILALLAVSPWQVQVGRLRCLRGIDTPTAVGLCAEVGDFERFARAEQLMSYVGLVPSENTTGQQRRLGSTMVLRHTKPAYISLTARRAQHAGPPPAQSSTPTTHQPRMREPGNPHLMP